MRQSAKGREAAELRGSWSRLPSLFIRLCEYWPPLSALLSLFHLPAVWLSLEEKDLELERAQHDILTAVLMEAAVISVKN